MSRAKAKTRGRTVDKWSLKSLYTIISPEELEIGPAKGHPIGETVASDPDLVLGRILEVPLSDLTQKFSLIYSKLQFKVTSVSGTSAKTNFVGHSYASDYIRSLVKRRRTRVDFIGNITTKDEKVIRLTVTALTMRRAKSSHKHGIRLRMVEMIEQIASEMEFKDFVPYMLMGDLALVLQEECQKIYPLAQVEVQKSKVLTKWI